jgi:hypothetical protein
MFRTGLRPAIALFLVAGLMAAGCGSSSSPSPTPGDDAPSFLLRSTVNQALPPEAVFSWTPSTLITADRVLIVPGAVPAIFPGPLVSPFFGRSISEAGFARIVERARELGLLEGNGDFSPLDIAMGAQTARIELLVDGTIRELTGDPSRTIQCITTPCDPGPGTPEAFATFYQNLTDLPSMLGGELGPEQPYTPAGYALLIGVEPMDGAGLAPGIAEWPLSTALADIGQPIANDHILPRCGTVREAADVTTLAAAFGAANQLTRWIDPGDAAADALVLSVRPLFADEDPCQDLFGIDA